MALTSKLLGALMQVDGRANEGGVLEITPGARLLLDVLVEGTEDGALLDEIAAALDTAAASAESAAASAALAETVSGLTGEDEAVRALIDTPTSQVAQGLSATIAARSKVTSFYDDFTTKPNGALVAGAVSDSGHVYSVLGQIPWTISGGRLTHVQTNPSTAQSSYLGVNLGLEPGDTIDYVWAEYEVPAGADPQNSLTLITGAQEFTIPGYTFGNSAAHSTFNADNFRYDKYVVGTGAVAKGRGQYIALTPGTYRVEITRDGTRATVTDPTGKRWRTDTDPDIATYAGPWATLQLYNLGDGTARKALRVLRWGAELSRRSRRGSYASASDVGRAATTPGRVLGAMQTSGANVATAITTSLSANLFSLSIPIPPSRRVLVEGFAWFDQAHPATSVSSALAIGVYPGGSTSYGKLTTIYSGVTPVNSTSSSTGRLFPFAQVIDLDPAFQIGDLIEFQFKAQASAASQFTFVNSGDASGSFSTLRRSTMKITELA